MLNPTVAPRFTFFYAVGNTPATSFTRNLPHGEDATVLSLGCGDLRNTLYTAYAEQGLPQRKLDFTCCDIDEKIIGRNLILLTLIIDNVVPSVAWDIYYHLYLDTTTSALLRKQADKLIPLLDTLQSWSGSQYGKVIKFCDVDTLHNVRHVCKRVAFAERNGSSFDRREIFLNSLNKTKAIREREVGSNGLVLTGMRSAAPLSLQSKMELPEGYAQYWKDGTVVPKDDSVNLPNPMFAGLLSNNDILHYGADPVLGFHLATAFAPLMEGSPLKIKNALDDFRAAAAAKTQFEEWMIALSALLKQRLVVRFVVADAFAFCHTLQAAAVLPTGSANWYRRQFDTKCLKLDHEQYGLGKDGPVSFDMIDTSNLSDHVGMLNILVAAGPLLKGRAWATLYTELLIKRENSQQEAFEALLSGHTSTMSLLLGVSPVQYWTNSKAESHVDEIYLGQMAKNSSEHKQNWQLHSRLAWKRDDHFSGQTGGRPAVQIEAVALSRMLYQVYLEMFKSENLEISLATLNARSMIYPNFHRGSFAVLLKSIKSRVVTEWQPMIKDLLDKIGTDRALGFSSNYFQELCAHLYMLEVVDGPWVLHDVNQRPQTGVLKAWDSIPPVVAVTVVAPREAIDRLYKKVELAELAAPTIIGSLRSGPGSSMQWHSMYGDVHIVFGNVKIEASKDPGDVNLRIEPDHLGWEGSSPLVASFYVPAASLQVEPLRTLVGLRVAPTSQNIAVFGGLLGHELELFETFIGDESQIFVSKLLPGHTAYPISCAGSPSLPKSVSSNDGATELEILTDVPASRARIGTLTGHLHILSEKGKGLLKNKATVELHQSCPFIINVIIGENELSYSIKYPIPVDRSGSRTRIARTSGYIEVIVPLADPLKSACLADYVYPSVLTADGLAAALNIPYINLDKLPILDLERKQEMKWLTTLTSLTFSKRETLLRTKRDASGISDDPRVNFKESVFTMFMLASGLQGDQTGLFALSNENKGGIQMLVLVSAMRLDGDTSSVVLDAALLPLTLTMVQDPELQDFFITIQALKLASMNVNDDELALWKKALPSMAERCRTWTHRSKCEYKKKGASIPLSLEQGESFLCTCGAGKIPKDFVGIPEWDAASKRAVRIAISPTYSVPFVEDVVDLSSYGQKPVAPMEDRCDKCGKTAEAAAEGTLQRCQRCKGVKYCSVECQKKDWKAHKPVCKAAGVA